MFDYLILVEKYCQAFIIELFQFKGFVKTILFCFRDGGKHDHLYMGSRHSGGGSSNSSHGNGESYDDNFPELVTLL